MTPLRIGFVGLGGICRSRHIPGLRRIGDVEIVAVANRTRESSERVAREFSIPVACESWQSLVERRDLDGVFIGTWPYLHCPISIAALESGKHVFCQARMAMNYAEAREMLACAERTGRVAMLCPVPIGLSVDATVARLLRNGALGGIRLIRVQSFSDAYASPDARMNWRKDHRLSGLNMLTMGMFVEVVHRWFGWTRAVSALTQIVFPERIDTEGNRVGVQIPDQILFNSVLESGALAQYVFSAIVHQGQDRIEIYGENGTLRLDVPSDRLELASPSGSFEPVPIRAEDTYDVANWRVERDFVDAVRHGTPYHPSFEDGARYMGVVEAVYESAAANGQQIDCGDCG